MKQKQVGQITHGFRRTAEYRSWAHAKARCGNPNDKNYETYGAKGIRMCEVWANDFSMFFAAVGPRPTIDHTLDRIDNSRGYEPGNIRWATRKEQSNNRSSNRFIEYMERKLNVAQWAIQFGISRKTLLSRLNRGISLPEAGS